MNRLEALGLASIGEFIHSNDPKDRLLPHWAGTSVKSEESTRAYLEARRRFFEDRLAATYFGRLLTDPVDIIIGDSEGLNPADYIDIFPEGWWQSAGYFTKWEPRKLFTDLEMYLPYSKPVAVTKEAVETLRRIRLDFVDASEYPLSMKGGLMFREATLRDENFEFTAERG